MKPNPRQKGIGVREAHGHAGRDSRSREYRVWVNMLARCYNERHTSYPDYGGRGIVVCDRWRDSFVLFLVDMGSCPFEGATIDRKNNAKGYSKKNCHWSSPKEQGRNRRNNVQITARGKTQCQAAWAEDLDCPAYVLQNRRRLGWSDADIINTPVKERLTPRVAKKIYDEYAKGNVTLEFLAEKYGSTVPAVQAITSGRNYSSATGAEYAPVVGRKRYTRLKKTPEMLRKVAKMLETMSARQVAQALGVSRTVIATLC